MKNVHRIGVAALVLVLASSSFASDATISSTQPSSDVAMPTSLAVGEIVKGRLADSSQTGKYHYWLVNLSPGNYKIVIDVRRADDTNSNVGGSLDWFTTRGEKIGQLLQVSDVDNRSRKFGYFEVRRPLKRIVRYSNDWTVSDYWLGLFPASAQIVSPFFVHCPEVKELTVGQPTTTLLYGDRTLGRDAYYRVHLSSGDYRVSAEFRMADGSQGNVGGVVARLSREGEVVQQQAVVVNDIGVWSKRSSKLSLADDSTILFRVRAQWAPEQATLNVEPWTE